MPLLRQSVYVIVPLGLAFIWKALDLTSLTVPALGTLVLVYLVLVRKKNDPVTKGFGLDKTTIAILLSLIFILIFSTGELQSPIFFLLYFIPFAITFVMLPEISFIFLLGTILIFLGSTGVGNYMDNLMKLGSLALMTPLAYFFGKEFKVVEEHQHKDEEIASRISQEAANVLRDQGDSLPEQNKQQLADIITESEELKKE